MRRDGARRWLRLARHAEQLWPQLAGECRREAAALDPELLRAEGRGAPRHIARAHGGGGRGPGAG
jgi:hypothetical protein